MSGTTTAWISRLLGPIATLTYVERRRELLALGVKPAGAKGRAFSELTTCSRCRKAVNVRKGGNKRQRADGGVDHVKC